MSAATVPDLIRQASRVYAKAPALLAEGREPLSYEGLYRLVRETRYALFLNGVQPGQRVAVAMPNGPEAVVMNLVAMSAGIAVPMDPALPLAAAVAQIKALKASVVVSTLEVFEEAARQLELPFLPVAAPLGTPAGTISLEHAGQVETERDRSVGPPFLPFSTAVVLQTSGATGEPKRVPLTHGNLIASATSIEESMALTRADRFLNITPSHRVAGLALVLAALKAGNAIYCAPGMIRAQFLYWAEAFQPTWFWAAPTMLKDLLPMALVRGAQPCGPALRVIRTGSASLAPEWLEQLEAAFGVPVVENYGMTEAAPQICCNPLSREERRIGSAGKPAGPTVMVLGEDGGPAPMGEAGEIVIRGANVMGGYESEETTDSFREVGGYRWFRTGDVGKFDEDGFLYLVGREKEMINRGGEKVWPRQVEETLLRHPEVEQAVVMPVPHPLLGEEVGAAVVLRAQPSGRSLDENEIREYLASHLPLYQIPTRLVFVSGIPVTQGGKVKRATLAAELGLAPRIFEAMDRAGFTEPRTAMERELAAMWAEILRAPRVGIDDDFFLLGGDSLAVAALTAAMQERFGIMRRLLDRAEFFEHPTIRVQAQLVEQALEQKRNASAGQLAAPRLPGGLVALNDAPRRRDSAPPLFLAPFAGHSPVYFRDFASLLAGQQQVFGLDFSLINGVSRLEDMAERFANVIESAAPEGSFFLGGHCFGGVLAYETARVLTARGRQPDALYLFDAPTPAYPNPKRHPELFLRALMHHGAQVSQYSEYAAAAWRHAKKLNAAQLESVGVAAADDPHVRAMRLYQPGGGYRGECVSFVVRNHPQTGSPLDRRMGWHTLVQPAPEVVMVDSSHLDLFDGPHAAELAAVCRQRMPLRKPMSVEQVGLAAHAATA